MIDRPVGLSKTERFLFFTAVILSLLVSSCATQAATQTIQSSGVGVIDAPLQLTPQVTTGVEVQSLPLTGTSHWYVSTTGNDANQCHSLAAACSTIQSVVDRAAAEDTIHVAAGSYFTPIIINKSITIVGAGMNETILDSDVYNHPIIEIYGEAYSPSRPSLSISGLTIQKGIGAQGGGISAEETDLYICNVRFASNEGGYGTEYGSGVDDGGQFSGGAGLRTTAATPVTIVITDSIFENNKVVGKAEGAAMRIDNGYVTLKNVKVTENICPAGAAVYIEGKADLDEVIITRNYGCNPLSVKGYTGEETEALVSNSIIYDNVGAVSIKDGQVINTLIAESGDVGLRIDDEGEVTIVNSTISSNPNGGIQIYGTSTQLTAINLSLINNAAYGVKMDAGSLLQFINVLIMGSDVNCRSNTTYVNFSGSISGSNNISDDASCGSSFMAIQDLLVGPLQDNGGFSFTHALLPGSPAIDAGREWKGLNTDQRGQPRMLDGDGDGAAANDIGAFESPEVALVLTNTPTPGKDISFTPRDTTPCRQGPAMLYAAVGLLPPSTPYGITGVNVAGTWYRVQFNQSVSCWVRIDSGQSSGDTAMVPTVPFTIVTLTPTITITPTQLNCSRFSETECKANDMCQWLIDGSVCTWK